MDFDIPTTPSGKGGSMPESFNSALVVRGDKGAGDRAQRCVLRRGGRVGKPAQGGTAQLARAAARRSGMNRHFVRLRGRTCLPSKLPSLRHPSHPLALTHAPTHPTSTHPTPQTRWQTAEERWEGFASSSSTLAVVGEEDVPWPDMTVLKLCLQNQPHLVGAYKRSRRIRARAFSRASVLRCFCLC